MTTCDHCEQEFEDDEVNEEGICYECEEWEEESSIREEED
jgi:hypothetical protein